MGVYPYRLLPCSKSIKTIMKNSTSTALVTGATSGIGHEIALLLAKDGYSMVVVGRDIQELNDVATTLRSEGSGNIICIEKDLFDPGAAEEVYNEVRSAISPLIFW